jgi:hypothetical protein
MRSYNWYFFQTIGNICLYLVFIQRQRALQFIRLLEYLSTCSTLNIELMYYTLDYYVESMANKCTFCAVLLYTCDYLLTLISCEGECTCRTGFEGGTCNRISCPDECGGVGRCQSMRYYALSKDPGSGTVYTYENIWDADMMWGCHCDDDYYTSDCSLRSCPSGSNNAQ